MRGRGGEWTVAGAILALLLTLWLLRPDEVEGPRLRPATAPVPAGPRLPAQQPPPDPVPVPPREPEPPAPAPQPAASFRNWEIQGRVLSEDGHPIAGAVVEPILRFPHVVGSDGLPLSVEVLRDLGEFAKKATTDATGGFQLRLRLPDPSALRLGVTAAGFMAFEGGIGLVGGHESNARTITLRRSTGIEGRVTDVEGDPVEGVAVSVLEGDDAARVRPVQTGPDGRFTLADAGEGEWTLSLSPPPPKEGEWKRPLPAPRVRGGDRTVEIRLAKEERREWMGARVVVRVVDPATGEAVRTAKASFTPIDRWFDQVPRRPAVPRQTPEGLVSEGVSEGQWRMWVHLADGRVRIVDLPVVADDMEVRRDLAVLAPGHIQGSVDLAGIALHPQGVYSMTAELASGIYYPQEVLQQGIDRSKGALHAVESLRPDGSFAFRNLVPAAYRLTLVFEDIALLGTAVVEPGKTTEVRLRAVRPGKVVFLVEGEGRKGWFRLSAWEEGMARKPGFVNALSEGGPTRIERRVYPGRVFWEVAFPVGKDAPAGPAFGRPQMGEAEVESGRIVEVHVPVEPLPEATR